MTEEKIKEKDELVKGTISVNTKEALIDWFQDRLELERHKIAEAIFDDLEKSWIDYLVEYDLDKSVDKFQELKKKWCKVE